MNIKADFYWDMVPCSWVGALYHLLSPSSSYKSLFNKWKQKAPSKTLNPDSQVTSDPRIVSPNTSDLSHQKPCDLKEIFLQLSLSPGDLMKKGKVFTKVLIFWRPDEKGNVFTTLFMF
jgi:hypothetical protein